VSDAAASPVRILIAEDDADILEMLEVALSSRGMQVLRARHGGEALALLRGSKPLPQLILLDLRMRIMDGKQFLAEKQADPALADIPVVVMSALDAGERRASGLEVAAWLSKPLRLANLFESIASVLRDERVGGS
jgi:DNA-binding response OmpR family regulator